VTGILCFNVSSIINVMSVHFMPCHQWIPWRHNSQLSVSFRRWWWPCEVSIWGCSGCCFTLLCELGLYLRMGSGRKGCWEKKRILTTQLVFQ